MRCIKTVSCLFIICVAGNALAIAPGLYWTDESDGYIYRSDFDGSGLTAVLYTGENTEPRDILIDEDSGQMYWTEWRAQKIRKANLDGTSVSTVINVGGIGSSGFDIDFESSWIFWAEKTGGFNDKIRRARLSGSGQTTLLEWGSGQGGAVDIALDMDSEKMYWTRATAGDDLIQRANFDGYGVETVCTTGKNPWDIELDLPGGKMYWTEYGGYGPGFVCRANLDGSGKETLVSGLVDPHGLALDLVAGKMYWADEGLGVIQCSNLDGTEVEDVLTGLAAPWGIDLVLIPEPGTLMLLALGAMITAHKKRAA
jgi:low density lipoprotein receptor-related protein 5/6